MLVAHHEHAAPRADKVVSQESVGRDALAALVVPLDACESRGKDDCLRAPPSCARVSIQLGSSKVCRDLRVNVDFLVGVSDDLLAAERSMLGPDLHFREVHRNFLETISGKFIANFREMSREFPGNMLTIH